MTNAAPLTAKQQQVKRLLDGGKSASEVAKALKISKSGVYTHMRRIREHGVALPAPTAAEDPKPAAASNGSGNLDAQGVAEYIQQAIDYNETRLSHLDSERNRLEAEAQAVESERVALEAERDRYANALAAVAG